MHLKTRNINTAFKELVEGIHSGTIPTQVVASRAGEVIDYTPWETAEEIAARTAAALRHLLELPGGVEPATDWAAFAPYTDREMTRQLAACFAKALARPARRRPLLAGGRLP